MSLTQLQGPSLMREYITLEVIKPVRAQIPITYREFDSQTTDGDSNYFTILAAVNYRTINPYTSNGITKIGQELL